MPIDRLGWGLILGKIRTPGQKKAPPILIDSREVLVSLVIRTDLLMAGSPFQRRHIPAASLGASWANQQVLEALYLKIP